MAPESNIGVPRPSFARAGYILPLAVLLGCASALMRAQEDPVYRFDTKLVNLWVNVTDKNGAIVGGLKQEDFKIAEDGRPQDIAIFAPSLAHRVGFREWWGRAARRWQ